MRGTEAHIQRDGMAVVIPVFNRAALVGETLESIERQSRRPDEVILVDNNSTDNTVQVLEEWAEKVNKMGLNARVLSEDHPGAAAARQRGLEDVTMKYVMFFDSDDWMPSDHIGRIMEDFASDPALDLICWGVTFHYPDGGTSNRHIHPSDPLSNHLVQGLLSTLAYAVRTDFIRNAGGWNPELGGWDDLELGVRLLLSGPVIKVIKQSRVDVRIHKDSMSGSGYAHRLGDWEKTLREIERVACLSSHARRDDVLKLVAYRKVNLAALYKREGLAEEAKSLRTEALSSDILNAGTRLLLKLAYLHTSSGMPGAGAIYPRLLIK